MAKDEKKDEAKVPTAAEMAEAQGRTPQIAEEAGPGDEEAFRSEEPPRADSDTEDKPDADANADEVVGDSDSFPNYMSTAGLNAIQRARVEGTGIDGAHGAALLGIAETRVPDRTERMQDRRAADAAEAGKSRSRSKKDED
jgi:hypothetical protein